MTEPAAGTTFVVTPRRTGKTTRIVNWVLDGLAAGERRIAIFPYRATADAALKMARGAAYDRRINPPDSGQFLTLTDLRDRTRRGGPRHARVAFDQADQILASLFDPAVSVAIDIVTWDAGDGDEIVHLAPPPRGELLDLTPEQLDRIAKPSPGLGR